MIEQALSFVIISSLYGHFLGYSAQQIINFHICMALCISQIALWVYFNPGMRGIDFAIPLFFCYLIYIPFKDKNFKHF